MNRNRKLVKRKDERHVQPSFIVHGVKNGEVTAKATKKKRKF